MFKENEVIKFVLNMGYSYVASWKSHAEDFMYMGTEVKEFKELFRRG